jgi:hypothetical protein
MKTLVLADLEDMATVAVEADFSDALEAADLWVQASALLRCSLQAISSF